MGAGDVFKHVFRPRIALHAEKNDIEPEADFEEILRFYVDIVHLLASDDASKLTKLFGSRLGVWKSVLVHF